MKTCILITSHLNNQAKINVAHQQLNYLQDKGYDIIYAGNYVIPTSIQNRVKYLLYTDENPIANRGIVGWQWIPDKAGLGKTQCMTAYPDYGYAHLYQTHMGFKFAKSLGYEYIIHLNYDIIFEDGGWEILQEEIKDYPNLIFKWGSEYATNKYIFKVDDFIQLMDKTLPYYKAGNPPGIKKDWFCEVFFKWAIEKENTPCILNTIIPSIELISNQTVYSKYGNFGVYYFREKDQLVLRSPNALENTPHIHLSVDNKLDVTFTQTPDKRYFIGPAFEGEYFDGGDLLFKLDQQLKERQWVGNR